jgi:hypothetical protein
VGEKVTKGEITMNEFSSTLKTKVGRISANSFKHREVTYTVRGELAFFEGDIVLGKVAQIEAVTCDPALQNLAKKGIVIKGDDYRWLKGEIPYRIDPKLPNPERVTGAIAHWEAKTKIKFIPLTGANLNQYQDRLLFTAEEGCYSFVGSQGDEQIISLGEGCDLGNAIHEIGHTVGLWHEQSRKDRDQYVAINYQNIEAGTEHNFDQHVTDGDDIGPYDYDSIMHYPDWAFSKNGQPTIVAKNGAPIGQRNGLSAGDIEAVKAIYPNL